MGASDFIDATSLGYGGGGKDGGESSGGTEAADNLSSRSFAKIVDLISTGPIYGPVDGAKTIVVGGTPLQNADGSFNARSVQVDFRTGTQTQDHIPGFPSVENEIGVGVELRASDYWIRAITNTQLSALRLRLSVSGLSKANTSNGDINGYRIEYAIDVATDGGSYQQVLGEAFDGKTTSTYERSRRIDLPKATIGWLIRVRRITPNANSGTIADRTNVVSYTEITDAEVSLPDGCRRRDSG